MHLKKPEVGILSVTSSRLWLKQAVLAAGLWVTVLVAGCTEVEPLYCDGKTPCKLSGQVCDYVHRMCVIPQDSGAGDSAPGSASMAARSLGASLVSTATAGAGEVMVIDNIVNVGVAETSPTQREPER